MVRRQITMDEDSAISGGGGPVPEVIRIRTSTSEAFKKAESESSATANRTTTTTEVIRHGFTEQQPEAENTSCGGVEVVRYQQRPLEVTNSSEMKSEAVKKKLPPQHQVCFL